jgi:predicted ester cyclase
MSPEEMKARTRRFFDESNKGKAAAMAALDEKYATDTVYHSSVGVDIRGLKALKQYNSDLISAFPDMHFTIDDIVVEGDKVTVRWTWTGTHKGELRGKVVRAPPTNKKVTMWVITISRWAGGKVVESWERYDTLGLMQQLGVIPMPKK